MGLRNLRSGFDSRPGHTKSGQRVEQPHSERWDNLGGELTLDRKLAEAGLVSAFRPGV
jgi:hypothetical protein